MALNKKKLMGLLALLLDDEEEEEKPSPVPSGLIPSFLGEGIEHPGNVPIGPYRPSDNPREGIVPIGPYRAQPNTGNPRDSMVPLINWQGSQEGWNNFLENWRRGGAAPQAPVAPGADRHPPMPPQNNFGMIPDFGMQNPFLGIDKSSPMPIPEGIEPYQPMQNQQTLGGEYIPNPFPEEAGPLSPKTMPGEIPNYEPMGMANEDRGNPFLTAQGVVDPETGQRRVSTPVGQPIPQPNEEVGFMDREISDHGQKMRNVMDAYYGGADFGYETEWADGLGVAQKDIDNFMAALNSGDIDAAMQSPTDFMLEEFERKWGWPLNVNSSSYTAPEPRAPYREPDIDETYQPRYPEWTPSVDRLFGPGNFEMSTQFRGQAPGLNDPRVRRDILEAASKGAIESIVNKYGFHTVQRVIKEDIASGQFHRLGDLRPDTDDDVALVALERLRKKRERERNWE